MGDVERGIYALTSKPMTDVHISNCRITEVQNGILLAEGAQGAMGNFDASKLPIAPCAPSARRMPFCTSVIRQLEMCTSVIGFDVSA